MTKLTTNVTSIRTELLTVKQTINALTPDLEIMHTDLVRYKQNLNLLAGKMSSMGDPARFSCAFTSGKLLIIIRNWQFDVKYYDFFQMKLEYLV